MESIKKLFRFSFLKIFKMETENMNAREIELLIKQIRRLMISVMVFLIVIIILVMLLKEYDLLAVNTPGVIKKVIAFIQFFNSRSP